MAAAGVSWREGVRLAGRSTAHVGDPPIGPQELGPPLAGPDESEPSQVAFRIDGVDFHRLVTGNTAGPMLFMSGKLKTEDDMIFAANAASLFRIPKADGVGWARGRRRDPRSFYRRARFLRGRSTNRVRGEASDAGRSFGAPQWAG